MDYLERRAALLKKRNISLVLDVGANRGQFAQSLRRQLGYKGRIVSFEPLQDAFSALQAAASGDELWSCRNIALGDKAGTSTINISANSYSSSLLAVSDRSVQIEPAIAYVGTQEISVFRLDDVLGDYARPEDRIYLKVDTQGYEM